MALSRPAHQPVTQAVRQLRSNHHSRQNKMQKNRLSKHTIWKIVLVSLVCTFLLWNSPALFFYIVSRIERDNVSLSASYASCEKYISDSDGIKVLAHREQSRMLGERGWVFVYSVTKDRGSSWTEFMKFYPDESVRTPKCENIKALDPQNFWVWEGWLFSITHDGGRSWLIWEPRDSWSDWKGNNFHLIMDVHFDNPDTGVMYLDPEDIGESSMIIQTDDGGKTWK